ncbi:MAG: MotA/TolQ/ExbB proton channel family protein, partial [Deltaproteobacteria bacterium]
PAFEVAAQEEIEKMKRGLSVLDTIVTLGPLLGILGTVLGIIESFHLLGAMGIENPRAVTGGIAQALITTAFGLSVAIVSLIPFNIFVSKVERAASEMEKVGARLQAALSSKEERDEVPHGI